MSEKLTDTIRNPHFANLAAFLNVPFSSHQWKKTHPQVPFWSLWEGFADIIKGAGASTNQVQVIGRFTDLIVSIAEADPRLSYSTDDIAWFTIVVERKEYYKLHMLFAYASSVTEYLTPNEVAVQTGTAASGWRNKAASSSLPGSIKKGKQWLINASVLRSQGIDV